MRRTYLAIALLAINAPAAAQTIRPAILITPVPDRFSVRLGDRHATVDDVLARITSFDADGDNRITSNELPERMQPVVAVVDRDEDGALSAEEIRTWAGSQPQPASIRGFQAGRYAMPGEFEESSRAHVDGVLADLKLPDDVFTQATTMAHDFFDNRRLAMNELLVRMKPVLTEAQLSALQSTMTTVRRVSARLGDADRDALLVELHGVLNQQELDDFRAALLRRPIVKLRGVAAR